MDEQEKRLMGNNWSSFLHSFKEELRLLPTDKVKLKSSQYFEFKDQIAP